jgi:hypothetical protein
VTRRLENWKPLQNFFCRGMHRDDQGVVGCPAQGNRAGKFLPKPIPIDSAFPGGWLAGDLAS